MRKTVQTIACPNCKDKSTDKRKRNNESVLNEIKELLEKIYHEEGLMVTRIDADWHHYKGVPDSTAIVYNIDIQLKIK